MPRLLEEIFIINSETGAQYIPFFRRYIGDSGRDIAAVKEALGEIYYIPQDQPSGSPEDNSIGESWFECASNTPVTQKKIKTFDRSLKIRLMNYQLQNQFVMLSYYFEKYGVRSVTDSESLDIQVQTAINFYDSEFGSIGEATIACLHGWRPNSIAYNHSFVTDGPIVIDQVPQMFKDLIEQEVISEPSEYKVMKIATNQSSDFSDIAEDFDRTTHSSKKLLNIVSDTPVVYPVYKPASYIGNIVDSELYAAAQQIMSTGIEMDIHELRANDRYRALSPMLEPDPLSDPDPFELGGGKLGFFDRTEFTLETLPNFTNTPAQLRILMEDNALHKVLKFYNKPLIWHLSKDLGPLDEVFFANEESEEKYLNIIKNEEHYRVTTRAAIAEYSLEETQYDAIYGEHLSAVNKQIPITFIEYRTPSLRPGDVYRSYFEIPHAVLNLINTGESDIDLRPSNANIGELNTETLSFMQQEVANMYCIENANSEEGARSKFEKYKAFAMKRKLEISRNMRDAATQASLGQEVNVDMGVAGILFDDFSLTGEDIVEASFEGISNIINRFASPQEKPDSIRMSVKLFDESIQALEKVFRSDKVAEDVKKFKISSSSGAPLNLILEADNLASFPNYLQNLAYSHTPLQAAAKAKNMTVSDLMKATSTLVQGTSYKIDFKGLQISQISVINITRGINEVIYRVDDKSYNNLRGAMALPRTVNYVRNINNILPLPPDNFLGYLEDFIGLTSTPCSDSSDDASLPAALILRYTINNSGNPVSFEFDFDYQNALHNWKENILQSEEITRLKDFYNDVTKNPFDLDGPAWGVDTILPEIGPTCDLKEIYRDVVSKKNMSKLLCNYLTCLKIPDVNVKIPKLMLPEFEDIPVFAFPGLKDLGRQILEAIEALFTRIVCAIVKNILDILSSPFCEDQMIRDLYGAAANNSSDVQRAFASAFLDVGIPSEKTTNVSEMLDDLINFLTPRELCALLNGDPVNAEVYSMIENLASNYNLSEEMSGRERIVSFFTGLGVYIPDEICEMLNSNNILGVENCEDTANLLTQIRNAATRGEVDPQQVEDAVAQLEKNLMDKSRAYELLTGEVSLQDMFPDMLSGDLSDSQALKETAQIAVDTTLQIVKSSFLSSMNSYVSSLYLDVEQLVSIDDAEYDPIATMKFLRATNNLQKVQSFNLSDADFQSQILTLYLRSTLMRLCDDYEKVQYGDFEVYRSQLQPLNREDISSPEEQAEQVSQNIEDYQENQQEYSPYGNISTGLKGSLIYGHDISEELKDTGFKSLRGMDSTDRLEARLRVQSEQIFSNVFEYMFPLSVEIQPLNQELTDQSEEPVLSAETTTEIINSWNSFSLDKYKGSNFYPPGGDGVQYDNDPRNISINLSYLRAIVSVISRLQQDIEQSLEAVFKIVNTESLLEVIRDFYNINLEALREEAEQLELSRGQLIKTDLISSGQTITLEHPVVNDAGTSLMSTLMTDKTVSRNFISNRTKIKDAFFLGSEANPETEISLCEEIPEQYKDFFSEQVTDNPLRRKVFKEQLTRIAKHYYDNYKTEGSEEFENIGEISLLDEAENEQYLNVLEGVVEQMISYMGTSRMFTDEDYIVRLDSKLKARPYFQPQGDNYCIVNPMGSFNEGAIKFDEIIADRFPKEYAKELADPANSIYTIDYSKPGPFEKAMMTTVILGYVKVVCLEALLKGAVAYSTWDVDFITPDPLFKQYIYKLVENAINKQEIFQEYPTLVDDAFRKISGTNNRISAIRKIVDTELATSISTLSKVLFENSNQQNYVHWFLNRMFIVDAPWNRRGDNSEWISELSEADINQYRKNSFTYMERYVRTNGQLNGILPNPEGLAETQKEALFDFIRFEDSNYSQTFFDKLHTASDPEFMEIPIVLDIPTRQQTENFDIGNQGNLLELSLDLLDNDQWPEKELYSLEDFNQLMISIFQNNPGVQKYIFHLLKKYYDEADQGSIWHGKPKTLRNKMPIKAIKRRRAHYKFEKEDLFSTRFAEDFEGFLNTTAGGGAIPRDQASKELHNYIMPGAEPNRSSGDTGFNDSDYDYIRFEDRYYISSVPGHELFDETAQDEQKGIKLDVPYRAGDGFSSQSPPRGITVMKGNSNPISPWEEGAYSGGSDPSNPVDKIEAVLEPWVGERTGLNPGAVVYENITGKVSESQYQAYTDSTSGILEEEIWDEYVIDLIGDASPFFNQPGHSNFDPEQEISVSQADNISRYLDDASNIEQYYQGNRYAIKKGLFCPADQPERTGAVFNAVIHQDRGHDSGDVCDSGQPNNAGVAVYISRGPGFEKHIQDTPERNIFVGQHAFFRNDVKARFDSSKGCYVIDSNSKILLEHNEYKIPVRILITQVKNSSGNIDKVFVRYLVPQVVTFSVQSQRGGAISTAVLETSKGYVQFYEDILEKGLSEGNQRATAFRATTLPTKIEDAEYKTDRGREIFAAAQYLMGDDSAYGVGMHNPVLYRDNFQKLPGQSSHGPNFFSISKLWSVAAGNEASQGKGHFVSDSESSSHSEFDKFFKHNVGKLLRKPSGLVQSMDSLESSFPVTLDSQTMPGTHALDSNNLNYGETLLKRNYMYHRASQHSLYEMDVENMIKTDRRSSLVSIGNLVGWFSQRRIDGFYGATSKDCKGSFNIEGVIAPSAPQGTNVSMEVLRDEAADFDCGPSLFYGDGRTTIEAYMSSLYSYLSEELGGNLDTPASAIFYNNYFEAFREQNIYKICPSIFRTPIEAPSAQGPGLWQTERPEQSDRPKTLTNHKSDIRTGQVLLNSIQRDFCELAQYGSSNSRMSAYPITAIGPEEYVLGNESETYQFFSSLNLASLPRGNIDFAFYNPKRINESSGLPEPLYDQIKTDVQIGSRAAGAPETVQENIDIFLGEIRNLPNLSSYYARIEEEKQRYPEILEAESDRFNRSLQWASNLISELYRIMAGLNPEAIGLLESLDAKHGMRMNVVLGQDSSDFENMASLLNDTRTVFNNLWGQSEVTEEERIGKIHYRTGRSGIEQFENYTSVPIAFHERPLFLPDICQPAELTNFVGLPKLIRSRDQEMLEALSQVPEFKTFYEFCIPYRRMASLLTVHSTSMLAGYSDMPSILSSTRSSLAGVFKIMAERNDFDSRSPKVFGPKFNNIEIMNAMNSSFPAGGEKLDCFSLPGTDEWFTMIKEMIVQFIKYFPAVILRGLADQMDPMYKEMKSHYFACEIPFLSTQSLTMRSGKDKIEFGLKGTEKGKKKYAPVFPSFPVDLGIGLSRLFSNGDLSYLGISVDKMISYAIGGPRQLIDASYAFQIPCLEDDKFNRTGDFRGWSKYRIGNHGRYGHPLTLLGGLALSTRHLPRDLEYRSQACQIQARAGTAPQVCDDDEE